MSNGKQDHVHRLIRSMTRPEKRYFKLHLARHAGNSTQGNHAQLFDAIAAMDDYDEAQLRRSFEGAAFLKHFAIAKRRLYETILSSLDAFHAEGSISARIRRSLHQTEILFDRGLYPEAERMLRSVRLQAQEHQKYPVLLEVVEWERRLLERSNYEGTSQATLDELAAHAGRWSGEWKHTEDLWQLKSRSFLSLYRIGKALAPTERTALEALLRDPLLHGSAAPVPARARYLYHHIRSALFFALGDLVHCRTELEHNARCLADPQNPLREEPGLQLAVLSNLAYLHLRCGDHAKALERLKEFRKLPLLLSHAPNADLELKVFAMGTSLEFTVWTRTGRFDKAVEGLAQADEGLARFEDRLSTIRKAGILFQTAWAAWGHGQVDEALRRSHRLLNEPGIEQHGELFALTRVLNLLLLLVSGKHDLLPYALRNTERHMRTHHRTFRCEEAIMRFVHQRMKARTDEEVRVLLTDLRSTLAVLAEDPKENALFDHFDPLVWVDSSLSGRPMAQVARERSDRTNGTGREAA